MKKILLLSSFICLILLAGCEFTSYDRWSLWDAQLEENPVLVEAIKPEVKFLSDLNSFNSVYKKALFSTWKWKKQEAEESLPKARNLFNQIRSDYSWLKLENFESTKDFDWFLEEITVLMWDAYSLMDMWDLTWAHEELELVRKRIMEVRQENWIKNISDDMLVFHDIMEEVVESWEKDMEKLSLLADNLLVLKQYHQDNDKYVELYIKLQNVIDMLRATDWVDYQQNLQQLKPAFIEIYLQFW